MALSSKSILISEVHDAVSVNLVFGMNGDNNQVNVRLPIVQHDVSEALVATDIDVMDVDVLSGCRQAVCRDAGIHIITERNWPV